MTAQETVLMDRIKMCGGPGRNTGNIIGFYPSDQFLMELTIEYRAECASVFKMGKNLHYLYVGTIDSILLPIEKESNEYEILIKHTHPRGTTQPSLHDIEWLRISQMYGSPQRKSFILPIGNRRFKFDIYTPAL